MYLSQLLKSSVTDSSDATVGVLKDVLIQPKVGVYNPLLYVVIRMKRGGAEVMVPYDYVSNVSSGEVALKNLWANVPQVESPADCVGLQKGVLDQQIVDVGGARVVRVNDLKLGEFQNQMCVLGIDVSFKGILRRLGLGGVDIFNLVKVNLIDWRKAQLIKHGVLKLNTISKDLTKLHPADLANIVEDLSVKRGSRLVRSLDPKAAAHVLEELDPQVQKTLITYLGPERAAQILEKMSIDEIVDLLQLLPKHEAKQFLSFLQGNTSAKVENLINYPNDTAGGLMTTDYVRAQPNWTVRETIEEIRRLTPQLRSLIHVYITDEAYNFVGSVSVRRLILTDPQECLDDIMKKLPSGTTLQLDHGLKDIIRIMTKYDLYTAAVIDEDHKLMGVVSIDDVMRQLAPNA